VKPWQHRQWCIPPEQNAEFVYRMEALLDLYSEPYDPRRPTVCFDELPYQLVAETRRPQPPRPGQPERHDYEYRRGGTANVFVCCQPQAGWRHVTVTERRTKQDFAQQMRELVDVHYPTATIVRVVLDNLNTHTGGALYEAFAPAEARRLLRKLEFHYTPKHGSWLNQAEIELSILSGQCLDRRIGDREMLAQEVAAWEHERNAACSLIHWRFTTADARAKLPHVYPTSS
jgi:DDE superfamily endonuclease